MAYEEVRAPRVPKEFAATLVTPLALPQLGGVSRHIKVVLPTLKPERAVSGSPTSTRLHRNCRTRQWLRPALVVAPTSGEPAASSPPSGAFSYTKPLVSSPKCGFLHVKKRPTRSSGRLLILSPGKCRRVF